MAMLRLRPRYDQSVTEFSIPEPTIAFGRIGTDELDYVRGPVEISAEEQESLDADADAVIAAVNAEPLPDGSLPPLYDKAPGD